MARGKALVLVGALLACNDGGSGESATESGFGSGSAAPGGVTGTTSGGGAGMSTSGANPGDPTTGPGVTGSPGTGVTGNGTTGGNETGNAATGNAETGNAATGNAETGNAETGNAETGNAETGNAETGAPDSTGGVESTGPGPGTTETTGGTTAGPDTSTTGGGDNPQCVPLLCGGKLYDCGDCIDNDGDGKVDTADPECVSPCDDREDSFATGLPGDNADPCKQDCFFDGNSGAGGGDCQWNLKCDPESPGGNSCPYDPNYKNCPDGQSQTCLNKCQVPNGCDCFGCCAVTVDGTTHHVFLGDKDCSLANLDQCSKCTPNPDCLNPCMPDECELCFAEDELPPGCEEPSCPGGQVPCDVADTGGSGCPADHFCSTGCCVPVVPG